ncbi:hypothetical protein [Nesterenkonia sp. CF4.4]|uniref:hypothetical protein n=1 Tax=Nesterenkonia sp. CF4.4 TaxID=3373079 RepID=UPI003EE77DA7
MPLKVPVSAKWWLYDENRLEADVAEITTHFPDLEPFSEEGPGGGWFGRLPLWPFHRPAPVDFSDDTAGLGIVLAFPPSYPMAMPRILPIDPEPEFMERTQHRWHVNGDGSLCLLQAQRAWTGRETVTDLLLKAAGWRLEYQLVREGVYPGMSATGIVTDTSRDGAIAAYFGASE